MIQLAFVAVGIGTAISTQLARLFIGGEENKEIHLNISFATTGEAISAPVQGLQCEQ